MRACFFRAPEIIPPFLPCVSPLQYAELFTGTISDLLSPPPPLPFLPPPPPPFFLSIAELFTGTITFAGRTNNEMLKMMMDLKASWG